MLKLIILYFPNAKIIIDHIKRRPLYYYHFTCLIRILVALVLDVVSAAAAEETEKSELRMRLKDFTELVGNGQNYKNQNVENQKELRK